MTARTAQRWDSALDAVVVYAQGALCRRLARGSVPQDGRVRVTGLPRSLDPGSLRARVTDASGVRVTEARVEVEAGPAVTDAPDALRREVDRLLDECEAARGRRDRQLVVIQEVRELRPVPPVRKREDPHRRTPVDAWLGLAEFVDERLAALQTRLVDLEEAVERAEHALAVAADRLARASTDAPDARLETTVSAVLTLDGTGDVEVELEYGVPGAVWVPAYRLTHRAGDSSGRLVLRASVAQRTGEDWTGVRIALATADLRRRTDLPRLRSMRIGRRQPAPPPSGWREPPAGLADLFTGYDAAGPRPARTGTAEPLSPGAAALPVAADGPAPQYKRAAYGEPPAAPPGHGAPPPAPSVAPPVYGAPPPDSSAGGAQGTYPQAFGGAAEERARAVPSRPRGGGAARGMVPAAPAAMAPPAAGPAAPPPPPPGGPAPRWPAGEPVTGPPQPTGAELDYTALVLRGPEEAGVRRGRLFPDAAFDPVATEHRRRAEAVTALPLPGHAVRPRESAGSFDHRFDAVARADIPSDGTWHTVTVGEIPVGLHTEYLCVPSVEQTVYATLVLSNSTDQALLAGPVEVTAGDDFQLTTALPTLAPGGVSRVGLGPAQGIRVTRRTNLHESTAGLRNSTTVLDHRVHVELANQLAGPVTVEVRERVPVTSDTDIRIDERADWKIPPEDGEGLEQHAPGTRIWRVELPAGSTTALDGGYEIRIASAKTLAGGNRRS
ncbi:DUF4139 domain-containing protein [Streptomyces asoensis]|uniref:DUF4139 domain-containing protein n=1 Tax=Streptomyces asoensis TaxID=249586 RepID=UPI0033D626BA